eukprot:scaffold41556_cov122-Skeletonema_dohrnii-CCMP3373.AAC.1
MMTGMGLEAEVEEGAIQNVMDPDQVQQSDVLDLEVDRITATTNRQESHPNIAENQAVAIVGH